MIKNIIFDIGNVILNFNYKAFKDGEVIIENTKRY